MPLLTPLLWVFSLQKWWELSGVLKHTVYGNLLWKPQETETMQSHIWSLSSKTDWPRERPVCRMVHLDEFLQSHEPVGENVFLSIKRRYNFHIQLIISISIIAQ